MVGFEEQKKCSSCGKISELLRYNGNWSCRECLGMDRRGVSRDHIIKTIEGRNVKYKGKK